MAVMMQSLTEKEVRSTSVSNVRKHYVKLAGFYDRMLDYDLLLCPQCGEWSKNEAYYVDTSYAVGRYPICKKCLLKLVEQRKKDSDEPDETKESVQKVLRMMNKVYDDTFYSDPFYIYCRIECNLLWALQYPNRHPME